MGNLKPAVMNNECYKADRLLDEEQVKTLKNRQHQIFNHTDQRLR